MTTEEIKFEMKDLITLGFREDKVKMVFFKYSHQTNEQKLRNLLNEVVIKDLIEKDSENWSHILVDESAKILSIYGEKEALSVDELVSLLKEQEDVNKMQNVKNMSLKDMSRNDLYNIIYLAFLVIALLIVGNFYMIVVQQRSLKPQKNVGAGVGMSDEQMVHYQRVVAENKRLEEQLYKLKKEHNELMHEEVKEKIVPKSLVSRTGNIFSEMINCATGPITNSFFYLCEYVIKATHVLFGATVEVIYLFNYSLVYSVIQSGNLIVKSTSVFSNILLQIVEILLLFLSSLLSLSYNIGAKGILEAGYYIINLLSLFV